MSRMSRTAEILAPPQEVFAYLDNLNNVGMHMTSSSMAMLGGKLRLQPLSKSTAGKGASYRWTGRVLGMPIDITETVTEWIENREKTWETVGKQKMIVMSSYRMHLILTPVKEGTHVFFEIEYQLPKSPFAWIAGKLLARRYADWCLRRATQDAKLELEKRISVA